MSETIAKNTIMELPFSVVDSRLMQGDCVDLLKKVPSSSIDAIITDPPYLFLDNREKNSAFDKSFNESKIFSEYKRILKPTGFLVFFGRGKAFYRWNVMVEELGFVFKEEIIWNKRIGTSPFHKLGRKHETIAVYSKSDKGQKKIYNIKYSA